MHQHKDEQLLSPTTMDRRRKADTKWSDIDKTRLHGIGTVMYSALTVALHPLTVTKIRRQVFKNGQSPTTSNSSFFSNIGQYYRGVGIVVSFAIPARIIYISVLESTREMVEINARNMLSNPPIVLKPYNKEMLGLLPLVTPFSGGIAGGLAAISSQLIVVPMDVISQKQMVMQDNAYQKNGSSRKVVKSIIKKDGWRGLYKGFGLSLFTSLPAGSLWWATYAGCRYQLNSYCIEEERRDKDDDRINYMARQAFVQVASAFCAAVTAAVATQPLDTIKTRIQVGKQTMRADASLRSMAREFASTPGLYKGLLPRIAHMGVWGSILSAAFEMLKLVSRKDYEF